MEKVRLGIALGSGAAKGWAHIGVFQSLQKAGIEPDIICGCSMGALVGAAYACGKLEALNDFATKLTSEGIIKYLDIALSGGGLINGKRVVELLRSLGVSGPIANCERVFAAVAADLQTGREIWLREGPIEDAVRASISIPGFFSPVQRGAHWLADGGLVNPVPVSLCRALGADIIIAVHVSNGVRSFESRRASARTESSASDTLRKLADQAPDFLRQHVAPVVSNLSSPAARSPGYFDVLLSALHVMEDQITRSRLAGEPPHILLVPHVDAIEPMEYQRAKEAIAEGHAAMEQALPALRRILPQDAPQRPSATS